MLAGTALRQGIRTIVAILVALELHALVNARLCHVPAPPCHRGRTALKARKQGHPEVRKLRARQRVRETSLAELRYNRAVVQRRMKPSDREPGSLRKCLQLTPINPCRMPRRRPSTRRHQSMVAIIDSEAPSASPRLALALPTPVSVHRPPGVKHDHAPRWRASLPCHGPLRVNVKEAPPAPGATLGTTWGNHRVPVTPRERAPVARSQRGGGTWTSNATPDA